MICYKLRSTTIAVHRTATRPVAVYIPSGTVLKVINGAADADGFVQAEWDGESVQIFAVDLRERGEIIRPPESVLVRAKAAAR
jgi:hypothetical protein